MLCRSSIRRISLPFFRSISAPSIPNSLRCRNLSHMSDRRRPNFGHNRPHESGRRSLAYRQDNKDMKPHIGEDCPNCDCSASTEATQLFDSSTNTRLLNTHGVAAEARIPFGRTAPKREGSGTISRHIAPDPHGLTSMETETLCTCWRISASYPVFFIPHQTNKGRRSSAYRPDNKDMKPYTGENCDGSASTEATQQSDPSRNTILLNIHGDAASSERESSGSMSSHIAPDPQGLTSTETETLGIGSLMLSSVPRDTSPQLMSLANEGRLESRRPLPRRVASPPKSSGQAGDMIPNVPFDICFAKRGGLPKLKAPLYVKNKERQKESVKITEAKILRPGMILLKNSLSPADQIKITKVCQDLGVGAGGFYQPGYNDGAKLHLRMMCLGKNWDPQKREYVEYRSIDGAVAPPIPEDFKKLVEKAIHDSHDVIRRKRKVNNPESILPWMQPDLCIVNFYSETGKLGLHQDRDESRESLDQKLPVVSFSIGDSAVFLYGDTRNVDEATEVLLESGDVLIYGGESRHVFHGVPSINKGTAPKLLTEETNLRPGRLNLTFRQY